MGEVAPYVDGRWIIDTKEALVSETAKGVARLLRSTADEIDNMNVAKAVHAAAKRAESSSGISHMVHLARGIEGIIVNHEDLDANPYIANALDATIDLRTGEPRPPIRPPVHQAVPSGLRSGARAPLWESCLERWQPDPEIREYLQREAGAGLSGVPTESSRSTSASGRTASRSTGAPSSTCSDRMP